MNPEELFGIKLSTVVAGIAGGIVSLTFEEQLTFKRALFLIFTGGVVAGYSSSILEAYLEYPDGVASAIAFFLGLLSMRIVEYLYEVGPKLIQRIVKRLTGYDSTTPSGDSEPDSSN